MLFDELNLKSAILIEPAPLAAETAQVYLKPDPCSNYNMARVKGKPSRRPPFVARKNSGS
jgi:hypothetical protein